jgi:hypothetical protein
LCDAEGGVRLAEFVAGADFALHVDRSTAPARAHAQPAVGIPRITARL